MALLGRRDRPEEQPRLGIVIGKRIRSQPRLRSIDGDGSASEGAFIGFSRAAKIEAIGFIGDPTLMDFSLHVAVALKVGEGALGAVDRNLMEVGTTEPDKLRVQVREETTLQQRILGEVD